MELLHPTLTWQVIQLILFIQLQGLLGVSLGCIWQVVAYTLESYCAGSDVMTHGVSGSGRGADYS